MLTPGTQPLLLLLHVAHFVCRFGGPANVARTVTEYARVGLAACHIEDQVQTKRCGHLMGKQVVSREEFLARIRAAVIARDSIPGDSDFVRAFHFAIRFQF